MTDTNKAAPLEDLMVAMDVVDTLRHQQDLVARELDGEGRRARLLGRLRELYKAQGIDVPDHVLEEGIDALEEERFQYQAITRSWRSRLAHLWVSRKRWGKPVGFLAILGSLFSGIYIATDVMPERALRSELPVSLERVAKSIQSSAQNPEVVNNALRKLNQGKAAVQERRFEDASSVLTEMQNIDQRLKSEYSIRVVSRNNTRSGAFRVPDVNQSARNYYLIVEAVDKSNEVVALDILDEESNQIKRVNTWGLRVNEQTYDRIAADKQDDGIIQNNQVGQKLIGYLQPKFSVPTTGGTITSW